MKRSGLVIFYDHYFKTGRQNNGTEIWNHKQSMINLQMVAKATVN